MDFNLLVFKTLHVTIGPALPWRIAKMWKYLVFGREVAILWINTLLRSSEICH